jgi:acetate kinase
MKVLLLNSGTSPIQLQLLLMPAGERLAEGAVTRIGEGHGRVRLALGGEPARAGDIEAPDHRSALDAIVAGLRDDAGLDPAHLGAVGHRVVHGGERFSAPLRVDGGTLRKLEGLSPLAPLHNPANLLGIRVCLERFPEVPQVAVFDTAFHQSLPPHAYHYALPEGLYTDHGVRRYGFHGTSHAYVARAAAEFLGRALGELRLITLHLGNGASAAAVAGGRSVDTTMGFTPLEGLMMGTRSGDLDPAVALWLVREHGLDPSEAEHLLNHESGLKGVAGVNDMREVQARADQGDERARLALEMYAYRIRKTLGAYTAVLGRVDAVVFTGGIGENSAPVRAAACQGLEGLGIALDPARNRATASAARDLSAGDAPVRVLVVPTDEELEIARQALSLLDP